MREVQLSLYWIFTLILLFYTSFWRPLANSTLNVKCILLYTVTSKVIIFDM